MPLAIGLTGRGLRLIRRPPPGGPLTPSLPPPPSPDNVLVTHASEPIVTETGLSILMEPS
ncbi:MAG: hypothetical protein KDG89_08350 [Geminicoccaceae bacterium]|nr:hypothetical protein [Geminicoccaceae bacterium]